MNTMKLAHMIAKKSKADGSHMKYSKLLAWGLQDAHKYNKQGCLAAKAAELVELQTRIANEKAVVKKIVFHALALGYSVSVYDGEEWAVKRSSSFSEIMASVQSTDSDTLKFFKNGTPLATVWLVYGNLASEVINDYTDNPETLAILKPALAKCSKLEEQGL